MRVETFLFLSASPPRLRQAQEVCRGRLSATLPTPPPLEEPDDLSLELVQSAADRLPCIVSLFNPHHDVVPEFQRDLGDSTVFLRRENYMHFQAVTEQPRDLLQMRLCELAQG